MNSLIKNLKNIPCDIWRVSGRYQPSIWWEKISGMPAPLGIHFTCQNVPVFVLSATDTLRLSVQAYTHLPPGRDEFILCFKKIKKKQGLGYRTFGSEFF